MREARGAQHGVYGGAGEEAEPAAVGAEALGREDAVEREGLGLERGEIDGAVIEGAEDGRRVEEMGNGCGAERSRQRRSARGRPSGRGDGRRGRGGCGPQGRSRRRETVLFSGSEPASEASESLR